jgi:N6-adenosine-specific RNA methylase IME4
MNVQIVRTLKLSPGGNQTRIADPQQHRRCLAAAKQVEEFNKTARASWHGWITITGPALIDCETTAQQRKIERGGRYEAHMSVLLKLYRLDDQHFDHTARADLIHIMKNLAAVSEWRSRQPNPEILNNPTTVWRNFCSKSPVAHDQSAKEKFGDVADLIKRLKSLQTENDDLKWELAGIKQRKKLGMGSDEAILKRAKEITRRQYAEKHADRIKNLIKISKGNGPLPTDRKYPVIYADPAWKLDFSTSLNRSFENHYPTMTLDEIKGLKVSDLATPDAVLFLWAISAMLPDAIEVMRAWGFTYKANAAWVKNQVGMGFWFRNQHELLLVGTRGEMPLPLEENRLSSVISSPRQEHSEKPPRIFQIIEQMYPDLPRIELFARKQYPGFSVWGNQCTEKHSVLRFNRSKALA